MGAEREGETPGVAFEGNVRTHKEVALIGNPKNITFNTCMLEIRSYFVTSKLFSSFTPKFHILLLSP